MASRNRQVKALSPTGGQLQVSESQTDSPILDIHTLEKLHNFRPDLVDWVVKQTTEEAHYRRDETHRINTFTFWERMGGLLISLVICLFAVFGSLFALFNNGERLAMVIVVVCVGTLAVAYLKKR